MKYVTLALAVVVCAVLATAAMAGDPPAPVYMSSRAIGGAALNQYTPGVAGGVGTNNIGLLIRTYGKVTYVDTANQCFYIDDGGNRIDGTKRSGTSDPVIGVRVSYGGLASGVPAITPPAEQAKVCITGIISTCIVDTLVQPNLRVRHADDIQAIP